MNVLVHKFKAVSNENRVKIIKFLIENGEVPLETLASGLKLPYKTVDRNLKILEKAGLVTHRRWKGLVYYSLQDSPKLIYNKGIFDLIKMHIKDRRKE